MASYTDKLKLLKKDPVADGDDTFNIETMLNENWDKIDEKVAANIAEIALKADKSQLLTDVPANAKFTDTVYTHPTTAGNKHIPTGGSIGQILKNTTSGTATWQAESVTPIANNLTETVAGKALDATQGKAIDDKIGTLSGVGGTVEKANKTDLTTLQTEVNEHKADSAQHGIAWKKIEEITLDVEPSQIDIDLSLYNEFRIIGKNIKSVSGTTLPINISSNDYVSGQSTYSYGSVTISNASVILGNLSLSFNLPCFIDLEICKVGELGYLKFNVKKNSVPYGGFGNGIITTSTELNTISFKSDTGIKFAIGSIFEVWGR